MTTGITGRSQRDADRTPLLTGVSSSDGLTPKPVEVDPTDGGVLVHTSGSSSGGTAPQGATASGSVTLTSANTAYAVPTSPPTSDYLLVLQNSTANDMYWSLPNSNSSGVLLAAGANMNKLVKASRSVYVYCATAAQSIDYQTEVL